MGDRGLPDEVAQMIDALVPADELAARIAKPLTPEEIAETLELHDWFVRRYPTARERLAYVRRAYARWTRRAPR